MKILRKLYFKILGSLEMLVFVGNNMYILKF